MAERSGFQNSATVRGVLVFLLELVLKNVPAVSDPHIYIPVAFGILVLWGLYELKCWAAVEPKQAAFLSRLNRLPGSVLTRIILCRLSQLKRGITIDRLGLLFWIVPLIIIAYGLLIGAHGPWHGNWHEIPALIRTQATVLIEYAVFILAIFAATVVMAKNYSIRATRYETVDQLLAIDAMPEVLPKIDSVDRLKSDALYETWLTQSKGEVLVFGLHMFALAGNEKLLTAYLSASKENRIRILLLNPLNTHVRRRSLRIYGNYKVAYLGRFWQICKTLTALREKFTGRLEFRMIDENPTYRLVIFPKFAAIQCYEWARHGHDSSIYFLLPKECNLDLPAELQQICGPLGKRCHSLYHLFKERFEGKWDLARTVVELSACPMSYLAKLAKAIKVRQEPLEPKTSLVVDIRKALDSLADQQEKYMKDFWQPL